MLNLVMTHSPRIAAMANNKRFGDDVMRNPAFIHRLAWLRKERTAIAPTGTAVTEQQLRERTA